MIEGERYGENVFACNSGDAYADSPNSRLLSNSAIPLLSPLSLSINSILI